ncbi:MAG: TIGR03619 family F420-dependent LLM class oxidoreductase [Novosphingobium sp.]|nr:TIGR03619 family F420-dependent LLM class oxidoreductase [Novosphingobium sp.]
MKLAFGIPNMVQLKAMALSWEAGVDGAEQTRLAKWAEKLGYEMICVPEHHIIPNNHVELSGPHYFNAYVGMAHFAGATETIRVNSCIAILPVQHPIITAKALSTMDWLSGGRVTVTFAVGWLKEEFDLLGVPFSERGERAEEYTRAIIELWTSDNPQFEGKYVSFKDVAFEPKPVQKPHVPIWFGGDADPVLKRTGRYATGWWPFLTPPGKIADRIDFIKSQPDYAGKLEDVFYGMSTGRVGEGHVVQESEMAKADQTKQQMLDTLGWLGEQGVTWSSVPTPTLNSVEEYYDFTQWVAEEIIPAVA